MEIGVELKVSSPKVGTITDVLDLPDAQVLQGFFFVFVTLLEASVLFNFAKLVGTLLQ